LPLRRAVTRSGVSLVLHGPRPRRFYAEPGLLATVLTYGGRPVLLAELQGDQMAASKKLVAPSTHVEPVALGSFGLWLEGGKHVLIWQAASGEIVEMERRLAGNVLVWAENDRTFRLEGDLDKGQMLRLARQITR
jgi:hypothetical protein